MKWTEEQAERLVSEYADLLLRVGYTWTGDPDDAQDVCQTVLLRRLTADRAFDGAEGERAWMIRVAINECKNLHRSAWRRHRAELDEARDVAVHLPEGDDALFQAVEGLPAPYRQVIFLHYYEGYGVGEIAELLGVRPNAVSTRLARARNKLRQTLGGEEDGRISQTNG